jgi:membrane-bound ClpP family serine protease
MSLEVEDINQIGQDEVQHRSRGYQLEMLAESLKENIIVAVCNPFLSIVLLILTNKHRWILEVERRTCK